MKAMDFYRLVRFMMSALIVLSAFLVQQGKPAPEEQ